MTWKRMTISKLENKLKEPAYYKLTEQQYKAYGELIDAAQALVFMYDQEPSIYELCDDMLDVLSNAINKLDDALKRVTVASEGCDDAGN